MHRRPANQELTVLPEDDTTNDRLTIKIQGIRKTSDASLPGILIDLTVKQLMC